MTGSSNVNRATGASLVTQLRLRKWALVGATPVAGVVAGLFMALQGSTAVYAANECGAITNTTPTDTIACGTENEANGITYGNANTDGPIQFSFVNTQVTGGGVLISTNQDGESVLAETFLQGVGPAPSITNGAGLNADAGFDISTDGDNAGITFNHNAGTITGGGGALATHAGVTLETGGANSDIAMTMAEGTTISGSSGDGINLTATGGSNITAEIDGAVSSAANLFGVGTGTGIDAGASGGSGSIDLDITENATVSGSLAGISASTAGTGTIDIDVHAAVSQTSVSAGLGPIVPVGIFAASNNGDIDIETHEGGTVNAIGIEASGTIGSLGISALSLGSGNIDVTTGDTVTAVGTGISGVANTGDVTITNNAAVTVTGAAANASVGIAGLSDSGSVEINVEADVNGGDADTGVSATVLSLLNSASDDATVEQADGTTIGGHNGVAVTNNGSGDAIYDADVDGDEETTAIVNATDGVGIFATASGTGNAVVTSGTVTSAGGSGVVALASGGGNASVDTLGEISVTDGTFGAAAISVGGSAVVNVGGDIDPPLVGAAAISVGAMEAQVNVLEGFDVEGDLVGAGALNIGDGNAGVDIADNSTVFGGFLGVGVVDIDGAGNVLVNVGSDDSDGVGAQVTSDGAGILVVKGFGDGDVTVNIREDSSVVSQSTAITVLAGNPNGATINNDGLIQGNGALAPVIFGATAGAFVINNGELGVITGEEGAGGTPLSGFEPLIVTLGGPTTVNNEGEMYGTALLNDLSGTGNVVNNDGYWRTGGINSLLSGTDQDAINNTGLIEMLPSFFPNLFVVDNFNNAGGVLSTQANALPFDFTIMTGNFSGGPGSTLAIDAALTPGGIADLLFVAGNIDDAQGVVGDGGTRVAVFDVDGGPGEFDPDGVLFALVAGDTDEDDFNTGGGIDKGFFKYDTFLRPDTVSLSGLNEWYLANTLNENAFALPHVVAGANNLWNVAAGTWGERTADLRSSYYAGTIEGGSASTFGADLAPADAPVAPAPVAAAARPGVWFKVYGGHDSRDLDNSVAVPGGGLGGSVSLGDEVSQNYFGGMVGIDTAVGSGPASAWLLGVFGGYGGSSQSFDSGVDIDHEAASLGAYATYLSGGFFFDAMFKAAFGSASYSASSGGGGSFESDFTSLGGVLDTGYRFSSAGWFFEPKATLTYVSTEVDDARVFGASVGFDDGQSVRGRLGARIGTAFVGGSARYEPFVEASYWNEMDGDYSATIASNVNLPVGFDGGGDYAELAAGVNAFDMGGGWSAYAKGDFKWGEDDFRGATYQGGVRFNF